MVPGWGMGEDGAGFMEMTLFLQGPEGGPSHLKECHRDNQGRGNSWAEVTARAVA